MLPTLNAWGLAIDLGLALLLGYVVPLWVGGWALELLARDHFHRARRFAHTGFKYDSELDRYEMVRQAFAGLMACRPNKVYKVGLTSGITACALSGWPPWFQSDPLTACHASCMRRGKRHAYPLPMTA